MQFRTAALAKRTLTQVRAACLTALMLGAVCSPANAETSSQPAGPETPKVDFSCSARPDPTVDAICIRRDHFVADVCTAIRAFAVDWQLPPDYLARLIWQESRFNPSAVSPAGAEGIAQFMPSTARLRGLQDPFQPAEALARSAEYLKFLEGKFGSLGLAAAAYNSGEGRTARITTTGGAFPSETRAFVRIITGIPVEQWLENNTQKADYTLRPDKSFHDACLDMASAVRTPDFMPSQADWRPWGVQLAQFFSAETARTAFRRLQKQFPKLVGGERMMMVSGRNPAFGPRIRHSAMIGRDTQKEADALCTTLRQAGAACIVRKNE